VGHPVQLTQVVHDVSQVLSGRGELPGEVPERLTRDHGVEPHLDGLGRGAGDSLRSEEHGRGRDQESDQDRHEPSAAGEPEAAQPQKPTASPSDLDAVADGGSSAATDGGVVVAGRGTRGTTVAVAVLVMVSTPFRSEQLFVEHVFVERLYPCVARGSDTRRAISNTCLMPSSLCPRVVGSAMAGLSV
jgi:hypothetical protein